MQEEASDTECCAFQQHSVQGPGDGYFQRVFKKQTPADSKSSTTLQRPDKIPYFLK